MAYYVLELEKTHFIVFSKETKRGGGGSNNIDKQNLSWRDCDAFVGILTLIVEEGMDMRLIDTRKKGRWIKLN